MKFDVDYTKLDSKLSEPVTYKYAEVKDRLVKVAFDIVRFRDSDSIDGLWQIQQTDDGEVIIATYDIDNKEVSKQSSKENTDWQVRSNATGTNVSVFYKNEPVSKIATASLGIPAEDVEIVCGLLPEKLASDSKFRSALLSELSDNQRMDILNKYPELK